MSGSLSRLESKMRTKPRARSRVRRANTDESLESFDSNWLINMLSAQDERMEESRTHEGYTHVSALLNFCPRAFRLIKEHGINDARSVRSCDRVMWAIGRSVESHVRNQFFKAHKPSMVGIWHCTCGRLKRSGGWIHSVCDQCGTPADHYAEKTLFDHDNMIVGNPDLLISQDGKLRVIEVKSINKKDFDALTKPKPDHVFQLNHYVRMLGAEAHDTNVVFYTSKDYQWASPYKEYHVGRNEQKAAIDLSLRNAKEFNDSARDGTLPERLRACDSPSSSRAKKCPACVHCFNTD